MDDKVFLRPLIEQDAYRMLEWMHDEDATRFLRIEGKTLSVEDAKRFIRNAQDEGRNLHRAISSLEGKYLGIISLKNIDLQKREAEFAVAMHPDAMGTGASRHASEQIVDIAFNNLRLDRVYLNVLEENSRAVRFYEKLSDIGLKRYNEGVVEFNGEKKNLLWYELQRSDKDTEVELSIIVPCYNVAKTVARTLDSILMQVVDFKYEIIIVDDASTDNSVEIYESYVQKYSNACTCIKVIQQDENLGNAKAFYCGLSAARGNYFCVLDGDDYYTIIDKLQRQVDFFRSDVNEEYVAVAHYHILDLGEGKVNLPNTSERDEFCYSDFLLQRSGYYHTSAYLYRNIFKGNVPEYYNEVIYRGDTPRTTFHLMFSNKKVKILNYVGSAYTFLNCGIWSGMSRKKQFEYQLKYLNEHYTRVSSDFEREAIKKSIYHNEKNLSSSGDNLQKFVNVDINGMLAKLKTMAVQYSSKEADFLKKWTWFSEYIDSACASASCMFLLQNQELVQVECKDSILVIIDSIENCRSNMVYQLRKIWSMYPDMKLDLFVTDMDGKYQEVESFFAEFEGLEIICAPQNCENKLLHFMQEYKRISPCKTYSFSNNKDPYVQAILRAGISKNICIVLPETGYFCGISNPNYDCYIVSRPSDFEMLKKLCKNKVIYNPYEECDKLAKKYIPFNGHKELRTACVSNAPANVCGKAPYSYPEIIAEVLKHTKGVHYHVGNLSDESLKNIEESLQRESLPGDSFVYIPDKKNEVAAYLLENDVDVVITSFPILSYYENISLISAGIPLISFDGVMRSNKVDYLYAEALMWRNQAQLIELLRSLDFAKLMDHSKLGAEHFVKAFAAPVLKMLYTKEKGVDVARCKVSDNVIQDVKNHWRIFANSAAIKPMDVVVETKNVPAPLVQDLKSRETSRPAVPAAEKAQTINEKAQNEVLDVPSIKSGWFVRFKEHCKTWDYKLYWKKNELIQKGVKPVFAKLIMLLSPYMVYKKIKSLLKNNAEQ